MTTQISRRILFMRKKNDFNIDHATASSLEYSLFISPKVKNKNVKRLHKNIVIIFCIRQCAQYCNDQLSSTVRR